MKIEKKTWKKHNSSYKRKISIYTLGLHYVIVNCMFIHAFSFFFFKFYSVNTCWMSFTDYWLEQHVRYLSSQSDLSRQWALVNINNVYKREFGRSDQFDQKPIMSRYTVSDCQGHLVYSMRGLISDDIIVPSIQYFVQSWLQNIFYQIDL